MCHRVNIVKLLFVGVLTRYCVNENEIEWPAILKELQLVWICLFINN